MKWITYPVLAMFALSTTGVALAKSSKKHQCKQPAVTVYKDETFVPPPTYTFKPNWYVGGHIGESRTHDSRAAGTADSVTQIGPGWTVDLGYQFLEWYKATLAAEFGYTQYHNSNETLPNVNVASTEHFATYLAGVVQYPLVYNFGILGKLGVAYSYAKKVFTASGAAGSANSYSLYWGGGLSYNINSNAALILQWARARGDSQTGSTDLTSLGISYSFL